MYNLYYRIIVPIYLERSLEFSIGGQRRNRPMTETKTSYATCPLCEATCGLEIVTRGRETLSIRGDVQDVFSRGHICPKAYSLKDLHDDPDRLREPMLRQGDRWQKVSWDDAFAEI